jgi:hypothetical protein
MRTDDPPTVFVHPAYPFMAELKAEAARRGWNVQTSLNVRVGQAVLVDLAAPDDIPPQHPT